jgi:hypothetical protein
MCNFPRTAFVLALLFGIGVPAAVAAPEQTIRRVQVLDSKNSVEIEIEGSDRMAPQTRVLTGPDRLVVDFPNAIPSNQLRSQAINRGEVKDVRIGLFQSNPPVTRVVLDLKSAQMFQVFPYGRTVIVKVGEPQPGVAAANPPAAIPSSPSPSSPNPSSPSSASVNLVSVNSPAVSSAAIVPAPINSGSVNASAGVEDFPDPQPGVANTNYSVATVAAASQPALQVTFQNGLLSIKANKATLSELLLAVHQRTGAEVLLASGAEQEKVVADVGPAPAPEVLAHLLNGSKFNFLILSSPHDPRTLERVILSPRTEVGSAPLPPMTPVTTPAEDNAPAAVVHTDPAPPDQEPNRPEAPAPSQTPGNAQD